MATTHADKTRKGQSYIGAYVPKELADRIDAMVASYGRSEFVRRALEREASRIERNTANPAEGLPSAYSATGAGTYGT